MMRWNPFLKWPRTSLILFLFLLGAAAFELRHFEFSSDAAVLLDGDQRQASSFKKLKSVLKNDTVVVIDVECDEVFSPGGIDAVYRVSEAFFGQAGLVDVKSLTHSYKPVRDGFSFKMEPLIGPFERDAAAIEALREFCMENPLVRNVMVSPDGRHTLITATYRLDLSTYRQQTELRGLIEQTLAPFEGEGLRFKMISMPLVEQEIRRTFLEDAMKFCVAGAVLLVVVLIAIIRTARLVGYVVLNLAIMILLLPAMFLVIGWPLNVLNIVLFPLLLAVQLTLLIHVVVGYQQAMATGGRLSAMEVTLVSTLRGCLFASMTTAVGMSALAVSEVEMIRQFGIQGAAGVVAVTLYSFGPALAVLALMPLSAERCRTVCANREARGEKILHWILRFDIAGGKWIAAGTGLAIVIIVLGVGRIQTDIRAIEFLNHDSPTRRAAMVMNDAYGGINVFQIEVDSGAPGGINRRPLLEYLQEIQAFAEKDPQVTGVYSYAQLLAMMNQIWEGGSAGTLKIPNSPFLLGVFVAALQSQEFPFLEALSDPGLQVAYLIVRMPDLPSADFLEKLHLIVDYADSKCPPGASVRLKDGFHSVLESERRVLDSQLNSGWVSLVAVGCALFALWRSVKLVACGLFINLLPVMGSLATAGLLGIKLNSVTIMVAAIAFGIAVDDTVHFITTWRRYAGQGLGLQESLAAAMRQKFLPIFVTSLILSGMFALFTISAFPPIAAFGLMAAVAMAGSFVAVVFLLPFAISLISKKQQ